MYALMETCAICGETGLTLALGVSTLEDTYPKNVADMGMITLVGGGYG